MIANYGYQDGSGTYIISVDTEKCDGCGGCVRDCPNGVFEVIEDPNEPMEERMVAVVIEEQRKKLKYTCASCKPTSGSAVAPCLKACGPAALKFSTNSYW